MPSAFNASGSSGAWLASGSSNAIASAGRPASARYEPNCVVMPGSIALALNARSSVAIAAAASPRLPLQERKIAVADRHRRTPLNDAFVGPQRLVLAAVLPGLDALLDPLIQLHQVLRVVVFRVRRLARRAARRIAERLEPGGDFRRFGEPLTGRRRMEVAQPRLEDAPAIACACRRGSVPLWDRWRGRRARASAGRCISHDRRAFPAAAPSRG